MSICNTPHAQLPDDEPTKAEANESLHSHNALGFRPTLLRAAAIPCWHFLHSSFHTMVFYRLYTSVGFSPSLPLSLAGTMTSADFSRQALLHGFEFSFFGRWIMPMSGEQEIRAITIYRFQPFWILSEERHASSLLHFVGLLHNARLKEWMIDNIFRQTVCG